MSLTQKLNYNHLSEIL